MYANLRLLLPWSGDRTAACRRRLRGSGARQIDCADCAGCCPCRVRITRYPARCQEHSNSRAAAHHPNRPQPLLPLSSLSPSPAPSLSPRNPLEPVSHNVEVEFDLVSNTHQTMKGGSGLHFEIITLD